MTSLDPIDMETGPGALENAGRPEALSAILDDLLGTLTDLGALSVGVLAELLQERGTGVLMVLFALFLALPTGILPGLNTIFAIPLILLAGQLALGRTTVWLPRGVTARRLDPEAVRGVVGRLLPSLRRLETLIRPRLSWVVAGGGRRLFGALATVLALFAAIPVPLTHTVPGFALLLFAIGFTMGDGLLVVLATCAGLLYVAAISLAFAFFGAELVTHLHALLAGHGGVAPAHG